MEYTFINSQQNDLTMFTKVSPVHTDIATVYQAAYSTSAKGILGISIKTDVDYKSYYLKKLYRAKTENILTIDTVVEGGKYAISYYHINGKLYCVWSNGCESVLPTNEYGKYIDLKNPPTVCPSCKKKLVLLRGVTPYCCNSGCPAKILYGLRAFLYEAHKDIVNYDVLELTSLDRLVTLYRIKRIPDIYSLRASEIDSLYEYGPVGIDEALGFETNTIGERIVSKLQDTIGNVQIYDYLQSLYTQKTTDWNINQAKFSRIFTNMSSFLDALLNRPLHKTRILSCMNEYTCAALYTHFQDESNLDDVCTLSAYGIFK